MRLLLYGLVILLASTGFSLMLWGLWLRLRRAESADGSQSNSRNRNYLAVTMLFDSTAQQFALVLQDILPAGYAFTVGMAVNRLITVRNLRRGAEWRDPRWSRIAHKSIDFVILRSADTHPVMAINLDVSPDAVLDPILRELGVPFLSFATKQLPGRDALQAQIVPLLGNTAGSAVQR